MRAVAVAREMPAWAASLATGMRASELTALRLDDVNLPAGYVICTGKGNRAYQLCAIGTNMPLLPGSAHL